MELHISTTNGMQLWHILIAKLRCHVCCSFADYTSALDKLTPSETAGSKGAFGSVQEYASSTAQAAAEQARKLKDTAAQSLNSGSANTGDVQGSAKSTVQVCSGIFTS